jgi:hypothetical protein
VGEAAPDALAHVVRRASDAAGPSRQARPWLPSARCELNDSGWRILVPAACWDTDATPAALAESLRVDIVHGTQVRTVSPRGVSIGTGRSDIHLQTLGPESLMRFTAWTEGRAVLALSSSLKTAVQRVLVQLAPLEADRATLRVQVTQTTRSTRQWAGFWSEVPVPVPLAHQEAIARAFTMHDSWVSPQLLERMS